MINEYDVVIIGAGPSGAVAGARLIQDGLSVLVLEKMEFPRFVIGESLLPQSMDYLDPFPGPGWAQGGPTTLVR